MVVATAISSNPDVTAGVLQLDPPGIDLDRIYG